MMLRVFIRICIGEGIFIFLIRKIGGSDYDNDGYTEDG